MKLFKVMIPALVLGLLAALPAQAQDGQAKKKGGMSPEQRVAQIDEAVGGLTADQKTKITAILNKVQESVMALPAEERGAKGAELRQAANKDIRAVLTDAQKAKFDAMPQGKGPGGGKKKD
jgi:Spy/CpxP family protein refolding chaperone